MKEPLQEEAAIPHHACYTVHVTLPLIKMQCTLCVCLLMLSCMLNACFGVRGAMHLRVCEFESCVSAYRC
jgi:hypothetical protein